MSLRLFRQDYPAKGEGRISKKLNIAIVGMGFGAEFIPIYQRHPHTNMYAICQRNKKHLDEVGDKFGYAKLLPEPIQRFTTKGVYDLEGETHMSFIQGGGHGGSHPHLVNEFVMSIVENREPFPNAATSANWTCTGICAQDSTLRGGEIVRLPEFTLA